MPHARPRAPRVAAVAAAIALAASAVAIAGTAAAPALPAGPPAVRSLARRPPVIVIGVPGFGRVLATTRRRALYTYLPEARDHRVHCTAACAVSWPPLRVPPGTRLIRRIPGISGVFGTVRRPGGALQVTRNGLPLYTFVGDGPGVVTGDGVAGFRIARR